MGVSQGLGSFAVKEKRTLASGFKTSTTELLTLLSYNLQISPDVNVTAGNTLRAEEYVTAEPTCTVNPYGVRTAVGSGAVEGDLTALVAVSGVDGPCSFIPTSLEVLTDLSKGEGEERKSEQSLAEHGCR